MTLIKQLLCLTLLSGCRAAYSADSSPAARKVLLKVDYTGNVSAKQDIEDRLTFALGRDISTTLVGTGPETRAMFSLEEVSLDAVRDLGEDLRQEPGVIRVDMEWSNGVVQLPAR